MRLHLLALASILAAGSSPLLASPFIPYATTGSVAPSTVIKFAGGADITAYFYSASAADTDTISIYDATQGSFLTPVNVFQNQTTQIGNKQVFTAMPGHSLNLNDILVFELANAQEPGMTFASDASFSTDGINHAYLTPFTGSITNVPGVINGTFVGMEDLPKGSSDLDYNDDTFVFTNVSATQAPEPSSFIMLGTGLIGAAGVLRRKFGR